MAVVALRLLFRLTFPTATMRLWDGAGPYLDGNGDIWKGTVVTEGLDSVEQAINGESATLTMGVSGITWEQSGLAWEDTEAGNVIGSKVEILIQAVDLLDQPIGAPEIRYTGLVDNIVFDDGANGETVSSTVMIECVNRFSMRNLSSGMVLSNVDQQRRSHVLNPSGNPDRICERLPTLIDKAIHWPVFN